ncbi:MAG: glycosyltransferase family 2 protein [Conexivisphaerales archaeon]
MLTPLGYFFAILGTMLSVYTAYWGLLLVAGGITIRKDRKTWKNSAARPRVSIIIPAKNEEKVIGRLLASLQTINYDKDKVEIIVSESGSTDHTVDVVMDFCKQDKRIRLVRSGAVGKGNALNEAIKYATGELFFFTDADCVPEKDFLVKAAAMYAANVHSMVGYPKTINSAQNILTKLAIFEDLIWRIMSVGRDRLGLSVPLAGPYCVISRKALCSVGFEFRDVLTEDIELWARLLKNGYVTRYIDAFVWQEAPSRLTTLIRQRIRWYRGYMETGLHHIDIFKRTDLAKATDALLMLSTPFFAMLSIFSYFISWFSLPDLASSLGIVLFVAVFFGANILGFIALNAGLVYFAGKDALGLLKISPFVYLYFIVLGISSSLAILHLITRRHAIYNRTEKTGYSDMSFLQQKR